MSDASYEKWVKRGLKKLKERGYLRSNNMKATLLLAGFITINDGGECKLTPEGEQYLSGK